jgi:outer membrane protein W
MRKSLVIAASLLFATSAFAQQTTPSNTTQTIGSNTVTGFVSNPEVTSSSLSGTRFDAGFGAAFDHRFSEHVSVELSVTNQRYSRDLGVSAPPTFIIIRQSYREWPVDATVSYHFFTASRWKPYLGGGVRYVSETFHPIRFDTGALLPTEKTTSLAPEVSGGVLFQFGRSLGLRLDAKRVLGSRRNLADPSLKVSAGLSWRF